MRLLLIEDDVLAATTLKHALKNYYIVETAYTGEEGEYKAQVNEYDVLLVDHLLPDINGIEVCKKLRDSNVKTPIIMVTANSQIKNKLDAFKSGIDDYITKPYNVDEVRARIEALLRRVLSSNVNGVIKVSDLVLDLSKRTVRRGSKELKLKRKEMDLLEYLMRNVGRVVSRSMIFDHVWESSYESLTNLVDVHIKYLRDNIDRDFSKKLIKTVHGYGYKLEG